MTPDQIAEAQRLTREWMENISSDGCALSPPQAPADAHQTQPGKSPLWQAHFAPVRASVAAISR